jgi:hypothetical protein
MNFFFGIKNNFFSSHLQIPKFQNRKKIIIDKSIYQIYIKDNKWKIDKLYDCKSNSDFYFLNSRTIDNNKTFFLANDEELKNFDNLILKDFNNYTDTDPAYRANFKIIYKNEGFSSYQSEYPFSMVKKRGGILSSINSIANRDAQKNFIFLRNIYEKPISIKFNAYIVNIKTKTVEENISIETNYTNSFEINNSLIKPEMFLITKDYLGIPMYVSVNNNHVSFEHTHPPHEYILSKNKFQKIADLKNEINQIIN